MLRGNDARKRPDRGLHEIGAFRPVDLLRAAGRDEQARSAIGNCSKREEGGGVNAHCCGVQRIGIGERSRRIERPHKAAPCSGR